MSLRDEFASGYSCDAPDYLPERLSVRVDFQSCLQERERSSVYLIKDIETGEKQILKITEKGAANNLACEYELLKKLDHSGIPSAIDYECDADGREYLLRAYAEGDTLKNLLERDGIFSERQTLEIAYKLCEVLRYLHGQRPQVIYRDITPENIVLTPNGKLSLIDFGISKQESDDKEFDTVFLGNAAFASPEQFGFTKTDPRSDIFAVGKLIIYLATGETDLQSYVKKVESRGLRAIIVKCTRLSPEKRYASVARLSRAIMRRLAPPTRREYLTAAICMMFIVAAGMAVGINVLRSPTEPDNSETAARAEGREYADEVKIPVHIEVLYAGLPYSDCAVAVDNHHWYEPSENGTAELSVYAYDSYSVRAVTGNRTAQQLTAVTSDAENLSVTFDLALVPEAPEYQEFELSQEGRHETLISVRNADEVALSGEPQGVSAIQTEDGFALTVNNVEQYGHYTIFATWTNEYGTADTVISLNITKEQEITYISTPQELDRIRENLAGHYVLANDIDLTDFGNWVPIGDAAYPFTGVFDGDGYEIRGLSISGVTTDQGLFGRCERARIINVILRDPGIQANETNGWGIGALVGTLEKGLVENCAVFGGRIDADTYYYSSVGGLCGKSGGIIINCFNSSEINVTDKGRSLSDSMVGGICGENYGYIAYCGNTGSVTSAVLAGGITSFCDRGYVTHCYNAGKIQSPVYYGEYPPGGIAQLLGRGYRISYCVFETGSAPVGATVWNRGTLLSILPAAAEEMRDAETLSALLAGPDGESMSFVYSLDAEYPVPEGILRQRDGGEE